MDKLKITEEDLSSPKAIADNLSEAFANEDDPEVVDSLPLRTRVAMAPLIVLLPILCLVTIVGRVALGEKSTDARAAWLKYTGTLLVVSSLLTCVGGLILYARIDRVPAARGAIPEPASTAPSRTLSKLANLPQFDEQPIAAADAEAKLKPLVFVVARPDEPPVDALDKLPKDQIGTASLL